MNDGFFTNDVEFASLLYYACGPDSLVKVEAGQDGRLFTFHFDIASLDGDIFRQEYNSGNSSIADARALLRGFSQLLSIIKKMRANAEDLWCSPSWVAGRGR